MNAKMIVPRGMDLSACCAKETSRYAIGGVLIRPTGEENRAACAATDGRCLALVDVEAQGEIDPKGVIVPTDVLPSRADKAREVILNGQAERTDSKGRITRRNYEEGTFPPIMDLIPNPEPDDYECITLSAELLLNIARTIAVRDADGSECGVTIMIPKGKPEKPILLLSEQGIGVQMPVKSSEKNPVGAFRERREKYAKVF